MSGKYLRTILLFLGIAGVVVFMFYPSEKTVECFEKNAMNFYAYGNSAVGMANVEIEPFAFKCSLLNESGHCGIGIVFNENRNWNLMDYLVLDLQSSANFKELIVSIQTHDPSHSKESDRNSMKPIMKEVKLDGRKRYSLPMNEFYTPDYWFEQQGARYINNPKRFSKVTGLEFFTGWKNPANTDLELKIEGMCVESHGSAPFIILVVYILILIIAAMSIRTKHTD